MRTPPAECPFIESCVAVKRLSSESRAFCYLAALNGVAFQTGSEHAERSARHERAAIALLWVIQTHINLNNGGLPEESPCTCVDPLDPELKPELAELSSQDPLDALATVEAALGAAEPSWKN